MLFARAHEVIERQARDPLLAILDDSGSRSAQGQTRHFGPRRSLPVYPGR